MNLTELYNIADNNKIDVDYMPMRRCSSISTLDGIALDVDKFTDSIDEKVHLAHELGHCMTGAFYHFYSKIDNRGKAENKANKWAVENLLPIEELTNALQNGITEIWELAELFDVTEDFVRLAVDLYKGKSLL